MFEYSDQSIERRGLNERIDLALNNLANEIIDSPVNTGQREIIGDIVRYYVTRYGIKDPAEELLRYDQQREVYDRDIRAKAAMLLGGDVLSGHLMAALQREPEGSREGYITRALAKTVKDLASKDLKLDETVVDNQKFAPQMAMLFGPSAARGPIKRLNIVLDQLKLNLDPVEGPKSLQNLIRSVLQLQPSLK